MQAASPSRKRASQKTSARRTRGGALSTPTHGEVKQAIAHLETQSDCDPVAAAAAEPTAIPELDCTAAAVHTWTFKDDEEEKFVNCCSWNRIGFMSNPTPPHPRLWTVSAGRCSGSVWTSLCASPLNPVPGCSISPSPLVSGGSS